MSKKSEAEAAEDRRDARADEKRERAAEDREAVKAEAADVAEADKVATAAEAAAPAEAPLLEYPKMLYIGARRQQVTVNTPEEEAKWLESDDSGDKPAKKKGER